MKVFVNFI